MTRSRWVIVLIPLLLGFGAYIFFSQSQYSAYVIEINGEANVRLLLLFMGVLLSIAAAAWLHGRQQVVVQRQTIRAEAAEDRRRFLRRLDHELKNPLTAIHAGLASIAIDEGHSINDQHGESTILPAPTHESHQHILQTVQNQAQRLSSVVSDLRKLADLESRPLDFDAVNLAQLLEDAFAQVQSQTSAIDEEELQMRLIIPTAWPSLPEIQGDEDLLFLAILNLLQNAAKFSQYQGKIELSAFVDGDRVLIKVADTGPGIPQSDLAYVWDELYRSAQTQAIEGSGLGLTFVRTIVARHNGTVSIISRPNAGTEVTVQLPTSRRL